MSESDYATIKEVFTAIESERDYQDDKWGLEDTHSLEEWVLYMEDYLSKARSALVDAEDDVEALENIRKVAGLAVAAMQDHGAPQREGYEKDQEVLTCPECSTDLVVDEDGGLVAYEEVEEDFEDEDEEECEEGCKCECETGEAEEAT